LVRGVVVVAANAPLLSSAVNVVRQAVLVRPRNSQPELEFGSHRSQILPIGAHGVSDPEQLLTAIDAARILGLSTDRVRTMRAANGYHLFRRADVERVAEERARRRAARTLRKARA
jgi:hypothetical protein